ncbi:peptidase [Fragilaria crotonensis]|nr:peptidase [Fragilaria crotonensis]
MKASDEDDGATNDPIFEDIANDGTIQVNPDYIEPDPDAIVDDADREDSDDDEPMTAAVNATTPTKATKSMLSKALSKPKKAARLLRKHKTKIIIVLVIFAFRKELAWFFLRLVAAPIYGENGKIIGRSLTINPTSILKLVFFIQLMLRSLSMSGGGDGSASSMDQQASLLFPRFHKPYIHVPPTEQHWTFERLNERYEKDGLALQKAMGETTPLIQNGTTPTSFPSVLRDALLHHNKDTVTKSHYNGTAIVMDLTKLTTNVAQMDWIRDQVSFILSQHHANQTQISCLDSTGENATPTIQPAQMEVIILLESPGGGAADYGLAAHQLLRLRNEPGITVTICVDKVAASGGYMMAATGHQILAAPFAVIGSIGVYGQTINIHGVLEGWGVKDLIFRAGKNKAPLGLLGEVTEAGRDTIQTMIEATHTAFKSHIAMARPLLAPTIEDIATGDVWLGYDALETGLVDRLVTSDEYIGERMKQGTQVLKLIRYKKSSFLFGPRSSSPDYSVVGFARSIAAEVRNLLLGSVEDESYEKINTRSFAANAVKAQSPIS